MRTTTITTKRQFKKAIANVDEILAHVAVTSTDGFTVKITKKEARNLANCMFCKVVAEHESNVHLVDDNNYKYILIG